MSMMSYCFQAFDTRVHISRSRYVKWENCAVFATKVSGSGVVSGKAVVWRRHACWVVIVSLSVLSRRYWPSRSVQGWTSIVWGQGSALFAVLVGTARVGAMASAVHPSLLVDVQTFFQVRQLGWWIVTVASFTVQFGELVVAYD